MQCAACRGTRSDSALRQLVLQRMARARGGSRSLWSMSVKQEGSRFHRPHLPSLAEDEAAAEDGKSIGSQQMREPAESSAETVP